MSRFDLTTARMCKLLRSCKPLTACNRETFVACAVGLRRSTHCMPTIRMLARSVLLWRRGCCQVKSVSIYSSLNSVHFTLIDLSGGEKN